MDELSWSELLAKEAELVSRLSSLSEELSATAAELQEVSAAIAERTEDVDEPEAEEGEEAAEDAAEDQKEEEKATEPTTAGTPNQTKSKATDSGVHTRSTGKKLTTPVKLGHYATPHTSNVVKNKERAEEKSQAPGTFRTNTGKATTIKSKNPPKLRKFDHW